MLRLMLNKSIMELVMSLFVEVENKSGGKIIINLDLIEKIIPSADGGCVLHFVNSYVGIKEPISYFSSYIMHLVDVPTITTKVNKIKKETKTE